LGYSGSAVEIATADIELLTDLTFQDESGSMVFEHHIFDHLFEMIDRAEELVLVDQFLMNPFSGEAGIAYRPLSRELADHLLAKKSSNPDLPIILITDPINDVYGGDPSEQLEQLRAAGVDVVTTNIDRLRDSNPLYSGLWRILGRPWGNSAASGSLPHPFDASRKPVSLRTYLSLVNFKVNHRKVAVCDDRGRRWTTLISSANPHDASSAHSNVAVKVHGDLAQQTYATELSVLELSGSTSPFTDLPRLELRPPKGPNSGRVLTEEAIRDVLLDLVRTAEAGAEIDIAVFYLSHRDLISELVAADARGVTIRIVLDPNRDAFGRIKKGIPNRPTAGELSSRTSGKILIRWYDTHGEQFHSKLFMRRAGNRAHVILGSANFTRRNLDGFNLETSVLLDLPRAGKISSQLNTWFERIWNNEGAEFTLPLEAYLDLSSAHELQSKLQEKTGLCTF
jgi:phosphatidylserine/phosphatidylglycerophosphate/cardiolipin synthase-like enzyme